MINGLQVIETGTNRMVSIDLASKLLQNNIILIDEEINTESISKYQSQILYLISKLSEGTTISLYINSPGGSVYDGLGLYDIIQYAKNKGYKIQTINIGKAASMAALLLMAGSPGLRKSLPNSSVLIHELQSMDYGKIADLKDHVKECERLQSVINKIISENADPQLVELCSRKELWLDTDSAMKYKIIDSILN